MTGGACVFVVVGGKRRRGWPSIAAVTRGDGRDGGDGRDAGEGHERGAWESMSHE